jgi:O-antigen/teichoic acid export membrane protein
MYKDLFNTFSGVLSKLLPIVLSLILMPQILEIVGFEAFSILGYIAIFTQIFGFFDLGLSTLILKKIAQNNQNKVSNEIVTIEWLYVIIGFLIFFLILLFSQYLTSYWIPFQSLNGIPIQSYFILIGLLMFAQWPISLYHNALFGFDKQILANFIYLVISILKISIGYFIVLKTTSIWYFIVFQIVMVSFHLLILNLIFNLKLIKFKIRWSIFYQNIKNLKSWILPFLVIGVSVLIATDLDKLLISKLLTVKEFALFSLIMPIVSGIFLINTNIKTATFPQISKDVISNSNTFLNFYTYQNYYIFISLPILVFSMVSSKSFIWIWTRNIDFVHILNLPFKLLVSGAVLFSLTINIQNYLTATNHLKPIKNFFLFSAFCFLFVVYILSSKYGLLGASISQFLFGLIGFIYFAIIAKKELKQVFIKSENYIRFIFYLLICIGFSFLFDVTIFYLFPVQ